MERSISLSVEGIVELGGVLTLEELHEVVEMFFRGKSGAFLVNCHETRGTFRGTHIYDVLARLHVITLSPARIREAYEHRSALGGNRPAPSLKAAFVQVLCHELQHANQADDALWEGIAPSRKGKYRTRGNERDARSTVDRNMSVIAAYCGIEEAAGKAPAAPATSEGEQDAVGEAFSLLEGIQALSVSDLAEELRSLGANNPKNLERLRKMLEEAGMEVE